MSVYDTTVETNRQIPLGAITTHRVVTLFERAVDVFTTWRNARATEAALRKLSDQQLDDIGLHRGNIAELAGHLARD